MDQQVDKKIELKDKIVNFFKKNKKNYFLLIFTVLLIILISAYSIYKEKNIKISQQFITAGILLSSQDYENSKNL